jgi:hypothetical protein
MTQYRAQAVAVIVALSLGASATAFQAPAVPAVGGPTGLNLNVSQIPTPAKGQAVNFSLCSGATLGPNAASGPCHAAEAAQTVSGAPGNSLITFRLQNGSFLPPGLHLNGDGVITGTTTADLSKIVVKICAIQVGAIGSNFNCQGQPVGFNGGKAVVLGNTPKVPAAAAPARAGGLSGGTKALIFVGVLGGGAYLAKDSIADLVNKGGEAGGCVGSPPDTSPCFSGNGNAPGCQAALRALDTYCESCGKKRGTLGNATDCVAK